MPLIRDALGGSHARKRHELPRLWGRKTSAGIDVTPERAMQISTVYACVSTHADDASQLPLGLYRRTPSGRQRVEGHPVMRLLTEEPNPTMDAVEMWQNVYGYMGLRGNGLLFVERNRAGAPVGLWPIAPTSAEPRRITQAADRSRVGRIVWNVNLATWEYAPIPDNGIVQPEDMLHFRLFGLGPMGLSPVGLARQQIGTSFAAQDYIGGFFARDASPGGVLSVEGELTDEQFERLERQWKDLHEGVGNSHRLSILEGGAKWANVSLPPADAAFLEVIKAGRQEIASMYRMPLHKIGDLDRATFNNIEQLSIEYVAGLTPYLVRGERVARRLFTDVADPYLKFDVKGLLRSDVKTRYEAYAMARQWGWASANDIRRDEDEDPIKNGDVYLQPLNMIEGGANTAEPGRSGRTRAHRSATGRQRIADSYQAKIADADRSVAKLERAEVGKLLDEELAASPTAFAAAITALYDGVITAAAVKAFGPVFASLAAEIVAEAAEEIGAEPSNVDAWVAAYTTGHVDWRTGKSKSQLTSAVEDDNPADAVRAKLDEWVEDRPAETARAESNQLSQSAARIAWRDAGVRTLRWRTRGDSCQLCQHLDGREIGIEQPFVTKGDTIPGGEGQSDLTAGRNHYTPPLHPGCDCVVEPA